MKDVPLDHFSSGQINARDPAAGEVEGETPRESADLVGGRPAGASAPTSLNLTSSLDVIAVCRAIRGGWAISPEQIAAICSQISPAMEVARSRGPGGARLCLQIAQLVSLMVRENMIKEGVIPASEVKRTRPERKRRLRGSRKINRPNYRELAEQKYQEAISAASSQKDEPPQSQKP